MTAPGNLSPWKDNLLHDLVQRTRAGYINAMQVYPFSDGALYQVYAAPGQITDIALAPGEPFITVSSAA